MIYGGMERAQPAFLLSQIGAHAALKFAERLKVLQLSPADVGILRLLRTSAGISQQELSVKLQIHPSRLVAILDNLEKVKLIERKTNPDDRRLYSLHLTKDGTETLERVGKIARDHQDSILDALNSDERSSLTTLLQKIAESQRLPQSVHPGYQSLRKSEVVKKA